MAYYPRIRSLRKTTNLTQESIAKQLGVQRSKYIRYELGLRDPPISFIAQLAMFYNLSSDYIMGLTNTPTTLDCKKH